MKKSIISAVFIILLILVTACGNTGTTEASTSENEVRYRVDYCGIKDNYFGAKDTYKQGDKVSLIYSVVGTDTDYGFYLDGEKLDFKYDESKGFLITFIMPDHDVKLEMKNDNSMMSIENPENSTEEATESKTEEKKPDEGKTEGSTEAKVDPAAAKGEDGTVSGDCLIDVDYQENVNVDLTEAEIAEVYDEPYSTKVVITAKDTLADASIVSLEMQDVDNAGNATYLYKVLYKWPYIKAESSILATLAFAGDIPNIGITYMNTSTGENEVYAIYQSGMDGSLCLEDITGYALPKESFDMRDILNAYSVIIRNCKHDPSAENLKYLVTDINSNGDMVLLIYFGDEIRRVYGYDGVGAVSSIYSEEGYNVTLYDDDKACRRGEITDYPTEQWYQFDSNVGMYLPLMTREYITDVNGENGEMFCYESALYGNWDEFERNYKVNRSWPVWADERGDDMTEEEFEANTSKGNVLELSGAKPVLEFNGF